MIASQKFTKYLESVNTLTSEAHKVASLARLKHLDPEDFVEVKLAKNMAERVVGLISAIAPQIANSKAVDRLIELEKQYGILDWRVALKIAEEIAKEEICGFETKEKAIEVGIKTGFAYVTVGVVSSPLEGLVNIEIKNRLDGKGKYFCLNYSGPIRNAGGTAASVSVIIADYVRKKLGFLEYDPTPDEIKRCYIELQDYQNRVTNLQYNPSEDEVNYMVSHLPVEISGDPSENIDVSNYKDLPRVPTNKIRSGYCLIHSSCIPLKAPKLWKQLSKWGKDFEMEHWNFLDEFLHIQKKAKALSASGKTELSLKPKEKITPDYTFIKDMVAGRPVLGHPLQKGAFRLRYGRSRTSGLAAKAIHPATMAVLDDFIAIGTTLKIERPGKGAGITPCNIIEGPIVKLDDGSVLLLNSFANALEIRPKITEILFLGDLLVNHGDFITYAHSLVPAGYCEEWYVLELEKSIVNTFGNLDVVKLSELVDIKENVLESLLKNPFETKLTAKEAIILSQKLNLPLHPFYTFHWADIPKSSIIELLYYLKTGKQDISTQKLVLPISEAKRILELLGIPHSVVFKEHVVIEADYAIALLSQLGLKNLLDLDDIIGKVLTLPEYEKIEHGLDVVKQISLTKLRDKSGTYIGARMSRPEKAKMRKLTGSPQGLFPIGEEGGRLRCLQSALEAKKVTGDFQIFHCNLCNKNTIYRICETCGTQTKQLYYCKVCGIIEQKVCPKHEKTQTYQNREIDINYYFKDALSKLKMNLYPDLIKFVRGTSNEEHFSENIMKGILRAKYDIFVNRDGTIRYDASDMGFTHFKPKEVGTPVSKLKELGYSHDIYGKELVSNDQILELFCQDILLPCCPDSPEEPADEVFFRVSKFIDDLLTHMYGLDPFYNLKNKKDLVGHFVICLAPHTSAGMVGRIIGFSKTQGLFAHPLMHQATRRDCDGDEGGMILLLDAFLNFSRKFLPSSRGAVMDAPLVLTSILTPSEVDEQIFDMDIVSKYPLELYEAALDYKMPWDVPLRKIKDVLNTEAQYEGMGFTHDTSDFNEGVSCSAYKTLPTMEDKLEKQMKLAEKIRAVNASDVAYLVIDKHFLRDTKGNLRKFSMQSFRCSNCNTIYRRPPLVGKCTSCGGKLIFTISEGSVIKYLDKSISLAEKYGVPKYMKQSLFLLKERVESVFGKEKEKQEGLSKWF